MSNCNYWISIRKVKIQINVNFPISFAKSHIWSVAFFCYDSYRNIIFYSVAAYVASHEEADAIAGGHTREDIERIPDVGEEFFTELEKILNKSTPFHRVKILTPVAGFRKPEILRLGLELGAPIGETWSCWSIFEKHCGKCPGCVSRREVFKAVGILDPTEYLEG
ncbi:MAG: 7-cyano-7-deazaguanine synthase [Candidatus Caldarchaeum sp.]